MPGLAGLTGLYGDLDTAPAGTIDEGAYQVYEQGGGRDESHGVIGDSSGQVWPAGYGVGYTGQSTYAENTSGLLAEWASDAAIPTFAGLDHGELDYTPSSHGGAYPVGNPEEYSTLNPDSLAVVGEQLRLLHGTERGGSYVFSGDAPAAHESPVDITVDRYDAPNTNGLAKMVGAQRGVTYGGVGGQGGGSHLGQADVDQGYGELNTVPEFQAGHSIRVVQHDPLHFDYTGLGLPNEGTWLGKHPVGTQQSFDGPDSPYGVEGNTRSGQMRPEIRGYPTEYVGAPSPTVLPDPSVSVDVWAAW